MAGLRKLVMNRTARLMTRIAIRRVVLMVCILSVVSGCWKVRKGMERSWVLDGRMQMEWERKKTAILGRHSRIRLTMKTRLPKVP